MLWKLRHDADTRELRLVATDLWNGEHERTEWRVIRADGTPIRNRADLDGTPVIWQFASDGGPYIRRGDFGGRDFVKTEERSCVNEKTVCRRMASKNGRAKCEACAAR